MILPRVRRTLRDRKLLPSGAYVLLGLSGGPDSGALLVALARLADEFGFKLFGASVNHGLREEAAAEVQVAQAQAARFGVSCAALSVKIAASDSGLQAKARAARYQVLWEEARRVGAAHVAVGHTLDDQAETVLMRQLRGSGLRGLSGIWPRRSDGVVRPLIDCPREDVHRFAFAHLPEVVQDPSNRRKEFERVRVRAEILPTLLAEDPRAREHLAHLADEARGSIAWLDEAAAAQLRQLEQSPQVLDLSSLQEVAPPLLAALFRCWLKSHCAIEPSRAHLTQLQDCLSGRGEVWLPGNWRVWVEGGQRLRLSRGFARNVPES